jgi:hypothetical protein
VVSKGYQNHAIKITQDLIRHMQPMGPGGFDFLSVAGKPVLADVNTGRFNGAHSPKLFVEMYAPQVGGGGLGGLLRCWDGGPQLLVCLDGEGEGEGGTHLLRCEGGQGVGGPADDCRNFIGTAVSSNTHAP